MKHTMWKRSIAFILTFVMLLSLIPLSPHVQAETGTGNDSSGSKDGSASKETAPHRGSAPNLSQLLADIEALEEPAPINQYYDHGSSAVQYVIPDAHSGAFFIVNVLTDSAGNRHAYAMDMSTPTKYGKATAVPVSIGNPKSNGLPGTDSYIVGMSETGYVSEDMSIEIKSTNPTAALGTAKYHTFKLLGPYAEDGMTYYLNGWPYDDDPDKTGTSYIVSIYPDKNHIPTIALDVRNIGSNDYRVSLTHTGPIETGGSDYYSYYALNTADPNAEEIYFELNTNLSGIAGQQTSFINYYNKTGTATYEQVTSFFFRRREDLVDTSELLTTIRKMTANDLLVWDDHYDSTTYNALIVAVEEAVTLYTRYNGLSVNSTTRNTAETAIADIIRDMMNLSAVLQINTEGNEGTDISYFPANMYRWNEDQMNLITKTKEEANIAANSSYVNKGFYFTSGKNVITGAPIFSKWNGSDGWHESVNNVLHDAQRFSISSGLASKKLSASGSPLADSTTVVEPGLWEAEDMYASDGTTQIKEVYTDVRVPFMYDKETGYYTLDSNTNGVFFEGTPEDGTILKISEKPSVFSLGAGEAFLTEYPDTFVQNKLSTYGLYDGYSAGFQPFVSLTNKEWKGFAASATQYDNRNDIVDGYLIQGIPQNTNTAYYGEMGNAVYGFGMALSIDFELTNDGTTNGRPITFDFGGDDDVWVYIDNELVLDIGGTHGAIYGTIDFSTGTVSVRYNETSRIRDMNGKYGRDESLYELSTDYTQTHGNKLQFGSVMAMKDGSTPVRMYQENLYTGAVNGNAASADEIASFSAEGTHTLKLFYMDRGRNRTNCYISFNLPRPDTLKVEKNIADTYGYMAQSGMEITDEPISEKLMASLLEETFTLVLKKNGTPVVSDYTVMEGNTPISSGKTDANGTFALKGNQAAHFTNLDLGEGSTYTVEELLPDGSTKWGTPAYTYTYIHADSHTETGIGNSYTFQEAGTDGTEAGTDGTETLTFSCTNRYADYTILAPEAQTVVLDYSKPIDIDVVRNAVVTGVSELIAREATVVSASMAEDSQDYGTLYATDGKTLRFTPKKMLDKVLSASCSLKLTFEDGGERQVKIPIYLMPATSVYYETDFTTSVFDLKAVGSEEYKYQWDTTGTSHYGEVQDPGNVGDQIYDFVIEKESVPSNAFFVDFDGNGYGERYGNQVQYGNVNLDLVKNYAVNSNRVNMTDTKINTADETYELYLSTKNDPDWYDRYIQTALDTGEVNKYSTPLFYSPGENDYVQVRFRMVNCDVVGAENFGFSFAYHRNGDSDVVSDLAAKCILEDETTDILAGNYVTVTLSLKDAAMYQAASVIYSFRFTFHNVEYLDATSKICIDYLYVGPLTDKDGTQGQALSSDAEPQELFFDFDNSTEAKTRYTQSQYNRNLIGKASFRNLDTLAASSTANTATEGTWVSSHSTPSGVSINNTAGTLTLPVIGTAGSNADRPYGPYLSTTSTHNSFPWSGSTDHHALDYTPQGETWFYMRFKLTGCALDSHYSSDTLGKKLAYVQFSVLDKNGKGYWLYPNYQFRNDEYITIAIDATAKLNECLQVSSIRSLYFRFTHLKPDGTNTHKIEIDYIYVGPKTVEFENLRTDAYVHDVTKDEALVSAAIRGTQGTNLYIGFDNSYNDQQRYTAALYGKNNMDLTARWPNREYVTPLVENGTLKMVPTADHATKEDGWADLCSPANSAPISKLSYTLSSAKDVAIMRVKFVNATAKAGYTPKIGIGLGWTESTVAWNSQNLRYAQEIDLENQGGQWVEYTFDLSAYYSQSKKITHLYPYFSGLQFSDGGYALVDYIYVGPAEEFESTVYGTDSAVYIGFSNTDLDKNRYAGTSYSGVNYDLAANWQPDFYEISNDQNCLKLVPKSGYTSSSGAYYGSVYPKHDTTKPTAALNYKLTGNDHFQMRFKLVNAETASGKTAKAKLVFGPDLYPYTSATSNSWAPADYDANLVTWDLDATDVKNGNWITVDYDLADGNWRGSPMEMIRFLIPVFQHIKFNSGGYALIDYIYVGPMVEARPVPESLFFGFDGQQADLERYASSVYGGYNFDDPNGTYWHYNIASDGTDINVDSVSVDTVGGIMEITATPQELLDDKYPCVYVDTNDRPVEPGQFGGFPLHYRPDKDHIFQIRFKMKDFINTFKWETSYMYICGYPTGQTTDSVALCDHIVIPDEYLTNDTYITLSIPLKDDVEKNPDIGRLRPFFGEIKSAPGKQGKLTIDYIYVGPGELAPDPVYGYDSSYLDDDAYSNGSSYVVEGQGVITDRNNPPAAYTEASFDFTGTGFDIISNTGKDQATIRVEVTKKGESTPTKTLTVNNKGELELYQIPVVSVRGLDYGEYTVTLWVNKAVQTAFEMLNRGGTFHFDAVRIYDPMGVGSATPEQVVKAYRSDKEANPHVKEIRNILLSADVYDSVVDYANGAIFVDSQYTPTEYIPATDSDGEPTGETVVVKPEGIAINGNFALNVETYNKVGPKNEVYLAPGQAVAFKLKISTTYAPVSVDIGAKIIRTMDPATLFAGVVTKGSDSKDLMTIATRLDTAVCSATAQYYALDIDASTFFKEGNDRYCYIVLYNHGIAGTTTSILSLTDLKLTYDQVPEIGLPKDHWTEEETIEPDDIPAKRSTETYYDFVVDGDTAKAAALVMKAVLETPLLADGLTLGHSLNLASDISINYAAKKADLEGYDNFYLECVIDGKEGSLRIDPTDKGSYYYFTLEGLNAVQMGNTITSTLYMEKDGRVYCSETDIYSIAQYAYAQLSKANSSAKLKTLCAELLRYGSKAQIYKNYRTDNLVDLKMTSEQAALLSDLASVTFGSNNSVESQLTSPKVTWTGKALILDSKVTIRYVVDIKDPNVRAEDLTLRVSYTDYTGNQKEAIIHGAQPYGNTAGRYAIDFDELLAAELRTPVLATLYVGETQVSDPLTYSADTYGNNKTGALLDLCRALVAYSDSAKAYFG